jgi:cystathionine gamma-synthase
VEELARLAHQNEALLAIDNTWPTPYNMQPLALGADLVIHSTTKYLGGHSDLLGGAVIANNDKGIFARIREIQQKQGAVPSPHDCWLMCRSIRSFPYRMRAHNENAAKVAEYLSNHAKVKTVYYPGLESHPGHDIAKREMNAFGGMISFLVDGNGKEALKVVAKSKVITRATSLGGVESTWEHRKSSEGEESQTPDNLIRLSVGLEHPDDIIEDLELALS